MRRVWLMIATATLVAFVGCGKKSYEERLAKTLEKLDYDRRLKKNLNEAPASEKKFTDLGIYVRPPKDELLAKTGQLPVTEGQFDLDASFNDTKDNTALHILARVKMPKKPPTKGATPAPATPPRGAFDAEVISVLAGVFGSPDALQAPKFNAEKTSKMGNSFKRLIFTTNEKDKEVKLYIYKQDAHDVALIFVYPSDPKAKGLMSSKIEYCLDSFATGEKAKRLYAGGAAEEEEAVAPGPL